jgi:hypothetical protein
MLTGLRCLTDPVCSLELSSSTLDDELDVTLDELDDELELSDSLESKSYFACLASSLSFSNLRRSFFGKNFSLYCSR